RLPCSLRACVPSAFCTLSLHDALPILGDRGGGQAVRRGHFAEDRDHVALADQLGHHRGGLLRAPLIVLDHQLERAPSHPAGSVQDRKSTRLNSSHVKISYAVFCLKKKR